MRTPQLSSSPGPSTHPRAPHASEPTRCSQGGLGSHAGEPELGRTQLSTAGTARPPAQGWRERGRAAGTARGRGSPADLTRRLRRPQLGSGSRAARRAPPPPLRGVPPRAAFRDLSPPLAVCLSLSGSVSLPLNTLAPSASPQPRATSSRRRGAVAPPRGPKLPRSELTAAEAAAPWALDSEFALFSTAT